MDKDSSLWLTALTGHAARRHAAQTQLHQLLLKVALKEAHRRAPNEHLSGTELNDLANQAAEDAMRSVLENLDGFGGECRFTTWACSYVVLEISNRLARDFWRAETAATDVEEWTRLPERYGATNPAQYRDYIAAVRKAVETLTEQQQELFVAIVVNGVSIDAMAERLGSTPGAIYKTVFESRRRIRSYLAANGYLQGESRAGLTYPGQLGVGLA